MFLLERSTKPRYRPGLFCILQEGIVGLSVSASDPAMMSGGLISNSSLSAGLAVTAAPITPPALVSSPQSQPVPTILSSKTALTMIFKLAEAAERSWRRLDGHNQLPKSSSV
jgi:hypothetical protein